MENREYPPGFSPEEIEERTSRNPQALVKNYLVPLSSEINEIHTELEKDIQHLLDLCEHWSSDCWNDYFTTIQHICSIFSRCDNLDLGKEAHRLWDWHCY